MYFRIIFLWTTTFLWVTCLHAQIEKNTYENGIVNCSIEDRTGNLWFGTTDKGVFRFDGRSFINFTEKEGLTSAHIACILEDKNGMIWIGTDNGICFYDGKMFNKVEMPHANSDQEKDGYGRIVRSPNYILSMFQDTKGDLWLGTMGYGIYRFDGSLFTFFSEIDVVKESFVETILEDKTGKIWFGTRGTGLWSYDGKSFANFRSEYINFNHILAILQDKNSHLWISCVGAGLRYYSGDSFKEFAKYDGPLFKSVKERDGLSNINVSCMLEDRSGKIWFATDGGGISVYHNEAFTYITSQHGLCNSSIASILEDSSGNIWFGTRNRGLCKYDGVSFTDFSNGLN
jgi:ligand-binding sensor domain-containing protein